MDFPPSVLRMRPCRPAQLLRLEGRPEFLGWRGIPVAQSVPDAGAAIESPATQREEEVANLRLKLGTEYAVVETVRGSGYRLSIR